MSNLYFQKFLKYKMVAGVAAATVLLTGSMLYMGASMFSKDSTTVTTRGRTMKDAANMPQDKNKVDVFSEENTSQKLIRAYSEQNVQLQKKIDDAVKGQEENIKKSQELDDKQKKVMSEITSINDKLNALLPSLEKFKSQPPPVKPVQPPALPPPLNNNTIVSQPASGGTNGVQPNVQPQVFSPTGGRPNPTGQKEQKPQQTDQSYEQKQLFRGGMKIYGQDAKVSDKNDKEKETKFIDSKMTQYEDSVKVAARDRLFSGSVSTAVVEPLVNKDGTINLVNAIIPARILQGIDAPTFEKGQVNPPYLMLEVLGDIYLPNDVVLNFNKCTLLAEGYGDLSSDRAHIRLKNMRCIKDDKSVFMTLRGYVSGPDGKEGVRGRVYTKQGGMVAKAMLAGFFQGFSQVFQTSSTTLSTSALGATQTLDPSKALQSGLYGGGATAFGKLADYYLKLVDMMHPIIEIDANKEITIIITEPAYMMPLET